MRSVLLKCKQQNPLSHWYRLMNTRESADATQSGRGCVDKQEHFVKSIQEVLQLALDTNELRHRVSQHEHRLIAHDSRITVVEVSLVDNTADIKKILLHVENSLTVADQKKLLNYLDTFETSKTKAIRYYIIGSMVVMSAVVLGLPIKDILHGLADVLIKAVIA